MTTNTYLSMNRPFSRTNDAAVTVETSAQTSNELELRIMVVNAASPAHNMTKKECLDGIMALYRIVMNGGIQALGYGKTRTTGPLPLGAPTAGA